MKFFVGLMILGLMAILILAGCATVPEKEVGDLTPAEQEEVAKETDTASLAGKAVNFGNCVDPDSTSTFDKNSLLTKSTTTYGSGSATDRCYTWNKGTPQEKTRLIEGTCKSEKLFYWYADCDVSWGKDYGCVDGKCVKATDCKQETFKVTLPKGASLAQGSKGSFLGKDELPTLLSTNAFNGKEYKQFLIFGGNEVDNTATIEHIENDNDVLGFYYLIHFPKNIAAYNLEFQEAVNSSIANNGDLTDFFRTIKILGEDYLIVDARFNLSNNGIRLVFNGGKIQVEITDSNILDNVGESIKVNGKIISNSKAKVKGKLIGNSLQLYSITVIMQAGDDLYVPINGKLSDTLVAAAEQKELLFTNEWDIKFASYNSRTGEGVLEIGKIC